MSRAKVQTSVTSVTLSGLPSMTAPCLSRVTETSCEWKRTVTSAVLPRSSAAVWKGCCSNAANAFFVHNNLADAALTEISPQEAWRPPRFLTSRNPDGTLSRIRSIEQRLDAIRDLPLIDATTGRQVTVGEACGTR